MIGNVALGVQQVMISGGIDVSFPAFVVTAMSLVVCAMVDWGVPETGALVPFLMDGFADRPELFLADGIHPTADAQALILDTVWAKLQPMLTQADARAQRR